MLTLKDFKDAAISGLKVRGGGDGGGPFYNNQTVIWQGFYNNHSAVDYRYDTDTASEHDVCTVIVD